MKKCIKRVVRSSKMVRTSTAGGSDVHVLMVCTEHRATSACTHRDTFFHESQYSTRCDSLQCLTVYVPSNVYVPSFFKINLKPGANQRPFLALFQLDLLVAFCGFDAEIVETIMKYFFDHASHWLS